MEKTSKSHALIVEGGAMRGIFSTGVLDHFLDKEYNPFDFCIGVSAGSTNLAAWLCRQRGRNYKVITDYSTRPQFISYKKFLLGGHAIDLDWLWDITIRELRLDLDTYEKQKTAFHVVTTNVATGKAEYFLPNKDNLENIIKASCAVPFMYRGFPEIESVPMADGGLVDPIPVEKAYEMGAREITVILSRPLGYRKNPSSHGWLIKFMLGKNRALAKTILDRWKIYNHSIDFIQTPPEDCTIHLIFPPGEFEVDRMTKDSAKLNAGYEMGLQAGRELLS